MWLNFFCMEIKADNFHNTFAGWVIQIQNYNIVIRLKRNSLKFWEIWGRELDVNTDTTLISVS